MPGLELAPQREHGVLSYAEPDTGGPPVMPLVVALALTAAGGLVAWLQRWWWLLAGAVVMTAGSALPTPAWSGAVTNVLELALLASVVATRRHQDAHAGTGRGATGSRSAPATDFAPTPGRG